MDITNSDVQAIRKWADKHNEIREVYLYGSRARGDNRQDSDIDLALVMEPSWNFDNDAFTTWMFWHDRYKTKPDLTLSAEVHLEWYEAGADLQRVGPGVEKDGIKLYPTANY